MEQEFWEAFDLHRTNETEQAFETALQELRIPKAMLTFRSEEGARKFARRVLEIFSTGEISTCHSSVAIRNAVANRLGLYSSADVRISVRAVSEPEFVDGPGQVSAKLVIEARGGTYQADRVVVNGNTYTGLREVLSDWIPVGDCVVAFGVRPLKIVTLE